MGFWEDLFGIPRPRKRTMIDWLKDAYELPEDIPEEDKSRLLEAVERWEIWYRSEVRGEKEELVYDGGKK